MKRSIAAILFSTLCMNLPAHAASKPVLPIWARSIADSASHPTPFEVEIRDNEDAVYLLREETARFNNETGDEESVERQAVRIFNTRGLRFAHDQQRFFDNRSRLTSIKTWTLKPNGRLIELQTKDIQERPAYPDFVFYSDSKIKRFDIPEAAPGDLIFVEITRLTSHPEWTTGFSGSWLIQDEIPTLLSRFVLALPEGWRHVHRLYNWPEEEPVKREDGAIVWEWRAVYPYDEGNMVRADRIAGTLKYNCLTTNPPLMSRNRETWADHARHYDRLSASRLALSAEMKQIVADLTASATTPLEKIRAISGYIRHTLTYLAVEVGVGGYRPHPVQEVFKNRYGDCKDMSSMLVSMLREAGVPAYPVLIRTMDQGAVDPDFPVSSFNHAIVYAPVADSSEAWIREWPDRTPLGRGLWIDATAGTCSIRDMPWSIQGAYALIVTPETGHLVRTPVLDARWNTDTRSGVARFDDDGDLTYEGVETFYGNQDMGYKSWLSQGNDQLRLENMEKRIGQSVARTTLTAFRHSSPDSLDKPMRLEYGFVGRRYMNIAGDLAFFRPNLLNPMLRHPFADSTRSQPVFYRYPYVEEDSLVFHLPESFRVETLPAPTHVRKNFGYFETLITQEQDRLIYVRRLSVSMREIPAEAYADVQDFFRNVIRTDRTQIVLKKRNAAENP